MAVQTIEGRLHRPSTERTFSRRNFLSAVRGKTQDLTEQPQPTGEEDVPAIVSDTADALLAQVQTPYGMENRAPEATFPIPKQRSSLIQVLRAVYSHGQDSGIRYGVDYMLDSRRAAADASARVAPVALDAQRRRGTNERFHVSPGSMSNADQLTRAAAVVAVIAGTSIAAPAAIRIYKDQGKTPGFQAATTVLQDSPSPLEATPPPTILERSPKPDEYSITHSSELALSKFDIASIVSVREQFDPFEPTTNIVIEPNWRAENDGFWETEGRTLRLSSDLFQPDRESLERQTVELPTAITASIVSRILAEQLDARKIQAVGDFFNYHQVNIQNIPQHVLNANSPEDYLEGIRVFNPYDYTVLDLPEDRARYDALLRNSSGACLGSILSCILLNADGLVENVAEMEENEKQAQKTLYKVSVARNSLLKAYNAMKLFSQPIHESTGEGTRAETVNNAVPRFGISLVQLDFINV